MTKVELTIANATGLHARPAALFVQTASRFKSKVSLTANSKTADGKSLLSVMGLGAAKGTVVVVAADGADEAECVKALCDLLNDAAKLG